MFKNITLKYIYCTLIGFFLFGFYYLYVRIPIIAGYTAKCACTQYFHNKRPIEDIAKEDFNLSVLGLASLTKNDEKKSMSSSVFGMRSRTAVYSEHLGCKLLQEEDDYHVALATVPNIINSDTIDWPLGNRIPDRLPSNVNSNLLNIATKNAFDADRKLVDKKTRSLLVVYKDTIILDVNQDGFTSDIPQLGWSMTKSWMNTLVGMQILEGNISLEDTLLFDHWTDERSSISLDDMLTMTTGIDWDEEYGTVADATEMLYMSEDIVSAANDNPAKYEPGTHWYYSSGTSNMISGYLRKTIGSTTSYLRYPYDAFFSKLGMNNSFMEIDENGNYIGSSYGYASTKDWAKFGLLYLHDGVWNGHRLLPEGWVKYTTTEVPSSNGKYGAQFWLNKRGVAFPDAPHDTYSANGYNGQKTIIIPSKDLVIVRLGLNSDFNFNSLIVDVLNAIDYEK